MKPESRFRTSQVAPFLKTLRNTTAFPIQQVGITGDPDYLLCCGGDFIALELKVDGKKPRRLQQFKLDQVTRCGGLSLVATPNNWQDIKLLIQKRDRAPRGNNEKNAASLKNIF